MRGRPRKHNRKALLAAFDLYIANTDIPIVSEFATSQGLHRQQLYDLEELSDAIKRCITKKEYALERGALSGLVNCTMAIFSLKQLGWKDAQKMDLTHASPSGGPIQQISTVTDDPVEAAQIYQRVMRGES